jgi:hypothetical protein
MNRLMVTAALACTAALTACGGGEVVVQAQTEGIDGQPTPIAQLQVRALPYDRDAAFDSLRAAYSAPEPEIPADLAALQDSMQAAQTAWTNATARWNAGRDSLATMSRRLQSLPRTSGEYVVLFRQYAPLEAEVQTQERTMNQQFQRFETLSRRVNTQAEETRRAREQWADAAYADIDRVLADRMKAARRPEAVDTTDANGVARLRRLKAGEYWIHARHDLPYEELYWNVPVTVGGERVTVQLTRQTAEVRPKL